eukprot:GFKZ01007248.1.p3 GENE.GFKZ01007248.1~~GFKZ01007248.1.p3  ORF type:complete len:100 (+),score=24.43 GFKZ01007248.1:1427-1726(+)
MKTNDKAVQEQNGTGALDTIRECTSQSLGSMRRNQLFEILSSVGQRQPTTTRKQQLIEKILHLQAETAAGRLLLEEEEEQGEEEPDDDAQEERLLKCLY